MRRLKAIKVAVIGVCIVCCLWWGVTSFPQSKGVVKAQNAKAQTAKAQTAAKDEPPATAKDADSNYVGSEICKTCHIPQFNNFAHTIHAKLETLPSWKDKVVGCEACHGPGKAHVLTPKDPTKLVVLKLLSPKESSETCLSCHTGKEEHNNFRRGAHWRNDVGCITCHAPHAPDPGPSKPGSITFTAQVSRREPDAASIRMLRQSEPQLCLSCHTEMKAQFHMPFRHKVLEGTMKCSDCHNPHGGFENKQTRLTTGADTGCVKCHADKQGPFAFEHAPIKTEGCTICHSPHGSSNPKLLVRAQVRQLCLECHSTAHEVGAPDTPVFHNQATVRFQNCTTCHMKIHGSHVDRFYFR